MQHPDPPQLGSSRIHDTSVGLRLSERHVIVVFNTSDPSSRALLVSPRHDAFLVLNSLACNHRLRGPRGGSPAAV